MSTSTFTSTTNITQKPVQGDTKQRPLLSFKEFTVYTIKALQNATKPQVADNMPLKDKYDLYLENYELVKSILNILATFSQDKAKQSVLHQMAHSLLSGLTAGHPIQHLITRIPYTMTHLPPPGTGCPNTPLLASPTIVTCLASAIRTTHEDLEDQAEKTNGDTLFKYSHTLRVIDAKIRQNVALSAQESTICHRTQRFGGPNAERDCVFLDVVDSKGLVGEVARFLRLCVVEVGKGDVPTPEGGRPWAMRWGR